MSPLVVFAKPETEMEPVVVVGRVDKSTRTATLTLVGK